MRAAAMLGVSYPYLLSVETGQRELSRSLARKIAKTFGVAQIQEKDAEPMIRDSKSKLVPFTKQRFENYVSARPSFYIPDEYTLKRGGEIVTPTPRDYARCARALLEVAEEQRTLRPVLFDFFNWFAESITSDAIFESLKRKFDKGRRGTSDAFSALTAHWGKRVEDELWKHQGRLRARCPASSEKAKKAAKEVAGYYSCLVKAPLPEVFLPCQGSALPLS
jgi:hypothetical protein